LTAEQACNAVWSVMDKSDTVYVADTTNNMAAWQNIAPDAASYIIDQWRK
jgi:hypothetical protein